MPSRDSTSRKFDRARLPEAGINPEDLIAAAHAGCYSMALAYALGQAGTPPQHIETTAALTLEMGAARPNVASSALPILAD